MGGGEPDPPSDNGVGITAQGGGGNGRKVLGDEVTGERQTSREQPAALRNLSRKEYGRGKGKAATAPKRRRGKRTFFRGWGRKKEEISKKKKADIS